MENLCIIILGQIRSFFRGAKEYFDKMISLSTSKYNKIHVIIIVSGHYDTIEMKLFIDALHDSGITTEFMKFDAETIDVFSKLNDVKYIENRSHYFSRNNNSKYELSNVDFYVRRQMCQFHQLQIGIDALISYQQRNSVKFNVVMKTRFDVVYHDGFYPYVPSDNSNIKDKILVNDTVKRVFEKRGIDVMSDEYADVLRVNAIKSPNFCVCEDLTNYSLGGRYLSNYHALNSIKNGFQNILYCINDHIIFGKHDDFVKLRNLVNEFGKINTNKEIFHYYACEAQLLMYCFNHEITPIMYLHDDIMTVCR